VYHRPVDSEQPFKLAALLHLWLHRARHGRRDGNRQRCAAAHGVVMVQLPSMSRAFNTGQVGILAALNGGRLEGIVPCRPGEHAPACA
jgi:hypothetical protein